MARTQAAIEKAADQLLRSPKYVQKRGESFGRHVVFLLNGLPREQRLPYIAGFVDVIANALDFGLTAAPATKAARRKGRT